VLIQTIQKYYSDNNGLNCAESMLYGANETYGFGLDHKALNTMACFGGGMGIESVCGALTGALAALGVMLTRDNTLSSDKRKTIVIDFYKTFEQRLGSDNCKQIKKELRDDTLGCLPVVRLSAQILEEIIKKHHAYTNG